MTATNHGDDVLVYLDNQLPAYPFDPAVDQPFVDELRADFPDVCLLDEIKAFRWYYANDPAARFANLRSALRRWIANAWTRRLSEEETRSYLQHHLDRVGARGELFTDAAHLALYKNSGGLCRQVNGLALAALTLGALEKKDSLDEEDVYRATAEL